MSVKPFAHFIPCSLGFCGRQFRASVTSRCPDYNLSYFVEENYKKNSLLALVLILQSEIDLLPKRSKWLSGTGRRHSPLQIPWEEKGLPGKFQLHPRSLFCVIQNP